MFNEIKTAEDFPPGRSVQLTQAIEGHFLAALAIQRSARKTGWTDELRATAARHDQEAYRLQDVSVGRTPKPFVGDAVRSAAGRLTAIRMALRGRLN